MADRPIIFSGPMVRALLDGRKTQTRRITKGDVPPSPSMDAVNPKNTIKHPAPYLDAYCGERKTVANPRGMSDRWCWWTRDDRQCLPTFRVRFVPGDRLWVRENCRAVESRRTGRDGVLFPADEAVVPIECTVQGANQWLDLYGYGKSSKRGLIVPSIHMPRWASRLTLLVTNVKVERLQDISHKDAIAEGIVEDDGDIPGIWYCPGGYKFGVKRMGATPQEAFRYLWEAINGQEAWEANPWVVAISFSVHKGNIDSLKNAEAA